MKRLRTPFLLLLLSLLIVACTPEPEGSAENTPVANSAETQSPTDVPTVEVIAEPTNTPAPAPTEVVEATIEPTEEPADEPLSLADMRADFSDFSSYTLDVDLSVINAESGKRTQFVEMTMQISIDPPTQQITMRALGIDESTADSEMAIELATVEGQTYMVVPEVGCIALPAGGLEDTPFADMMSASTFLDGVDNVARVRPNETINGIESEHYIFDETFFEAATDGDQLEGHLYIDAATQHLVRLEMNGNGADFANLSGQEGSSDDTFSLIYDVVEVNQPFEVTIPDGCEGQADGPDYPQLADATQVSVFGEIVTYKTASSIKDAVAFYQAEMEAAGWTYLEGESFIADATSSLIFTQAEQTVMVLIVPESDNTSVTIMEQ